MQMLKHLIFDRYLLFIELYKFQYW